MEKKEREESGNCGAVGMIENKVKMEDKKCGLSDEKKEIRLLEEILNFRILVPPVSVGGGERNKLIVYREKWSK